MEKIYGHQRVQQKCHSVKAIFLLDSWLYLVAIASPFAFVMVHPSNLRKKVVGTALFSFEFWNVLEPGTWTVNMCELGRSLLRLNAV